MPTDYLPPGKTQYPASDAEPVEEAKSEEVEVAADATETEPETESESE